ncbi:MAG: electron transfer flavoprotein-ubiquinone oxidoreductase [Candidatus Abyssobacteria bacterium SURF_5]|uniref:Electron transfer flavoprotein-ubiquinone oxidoreductase n=1 Tax=Abyssobacteria bacterium (strain SURF_5) TaxID=2093360 RepID=A0A3A4NP37_ABYX5|nr:MAG: electron transfer flavoprotein-ubiquinone oxidoreductase [Candidatus Abyssubacteria bacterium SURF_5]
MTVERESMEVDVLFVGGGPANLAAALHLRRLIAKHNEEIESGAKQGEIFSDELMIALIEKAQEVGLHGLSGAVLDKKTLLELFPDFDENCGAVDCKIVSEEVLMLTPSGKIKAPITPPPLNNHGFYTVSLAKLTKWMVEQVEAAGVDLFAGFPGVELLYEDNKVVGVRTGDKGLDQQGNQKSNFEPGYDLLAKVVVLGEGPRGFLAKQLIEKFGLDRGRNPQTYLTGVKEIWKLAEGKLKPGHVIHTMGYPHDMKTYGGGFIYSMKENMASVGLLTGLDARDPQVDPHRYFQLFKMHPMVRELLQGGEIMQYGAKTVPVGGWYSVPKLAVDGCVLVGDSASLFNTMRIKGIHLAMKSGMLAAETIFDALLKKDFSQAQLGKYEEAVKNSYIKEEMWKCRNFHQGFHGGRYAGLLHAGIQFVTGGRGMIDPMKAEADHKSTVTINQYYNGRNPEEVNKVSFDGKLTFDKLTDVYHSGTVHEEQQPCHCKILNPDYCSDANCKAKYNRPCVKFCPAFVYEEQVDEATGKSSLKLNPSNCLHCKTCDIKCPYANILWTPPEGGGGPKYSLV